MMERSAKLTLILGFEPGRRNSEGEDALPGPCKPLREALGDLRAIRALGRSSGCESAAMGFI
jgi:hypothetical protein